MNVKLLTEHHLEVLGFKGGCIGSSESTHVKMPHCWKSYVMASSPAKVSSYLPFDKPFASRPSKFINSAD